VSFFVFLFLLLGTYFTYQNWLENDSNLVYSENVAYSHTSKVITLSAPTGKRLVPVGAVLGVNDVNEVTYTFNVDVTEGNTLDVLAHNITFKNGNQTFTNVNDLLLFDYAIEMISESEALVSVSVSLRMPTSDFELSIIQGSSVSFQLLFNQEDSI
jgi:hypothetical protein